MNRYPQRTDCPDPMSAVSPEAEDEPWYSNPYPMANYYFPDFSVNNCAYGRDYPAWMGENKYEKHYLFSRGSECCSKFFPTASNCPYENTKQIGYYWESYQPNLPNDAFSQYPIIYNHTYYPDLNSGTCINGTDYPGKYIYFSAHLCPRSIQVLQSFFLLFVSNVAKLGWPQRLCIRECTSFMNRRIVVSFGLGMIQ